MQIGMVGLGRMGSDMSRRLIAAGHELVVYDLAPGAVEALVSEGATGTRGMAGLMAKLDRPRAVWLMLPAAVVDATIGSLEPYLSQDDLVVDGGNSHFNDDLRRAARLK
jgi:6-phosphogluconate dehydrogenase